MGRSTKHSSNEIIRLYNLQVPKSFPRSTMYLMKLKKKTSQGILNDNSKFIYHDFELTPIEYRMFFMRLYMNSWIEAQN